jgi:hypothetical protein
MCKKTVKFYLESLKRREYLEDTGVDGRVIFKYNFWKKEGRMQTGFISYRTGTSSVLL